MFFVFVINVVIVSILNRVLVYNHSIMITVRKYVDCVLSGQLRVRIEAVYRETLYVNLNAQQCMQHQQRSCQTITHAGTIFELVDILQNKYII